MRLLFRFLRVGAIAALALALGTCVQRPGLLEQIETLGTLRVATVNSATTYYLDVDGPAGFEYDLAHAFADELGLALDVMVVPDREAVLTAVTSGRAHIGVGLAVSDARRQRVRFTPIYAETPLEVVYNVHDDQPDDLAALSGELTLPAGSALAGRLRRDHPDLEFSVAARANAEELMDRVANGALTATIANAHVVAMNQRYYPDLRVAFDVPGASQRTAWAFARRGATAGDDGLFNKAIAYLERTRETGRMRILRDRYFGHVERLGFVGGREFARQVEARLDRWRPYFKRAGRRHDLDWRLLAAIGYQESHWDEDAVSPTTVRGIMMLTEATAEEVDVEDRRDPLQSINGGAEYIKRMIERMPESVTRPDRIWFALAAYNIGYGHVMDARRLLEARDRDPDLWINLRDALPWLTQDRYLDETRYGYARGLEARAYVGNVRAYYDILVWMTDDSRTEKPAALSEDESAAGAGADESPEISIESPAF